jgi:hypothetical protein
MTRFYRFAFKLVWQENGKTCHKMFTAYELAKSWAITSVSVKGEQWAIYDGYTGNVFWSEA